MRLSELRLPVVALACMVSSLPASAQQLISAKSGLIHYTEGDVRIGDQAAGPNNAVFQSLAIGKELTTGEGRAELLLGPGQFLRVNENSAIRMVSNKLESTRVDVVRGSVMVELIEIEKNAPVTIGFGPSTIEMRKAGLYRIDSDGSRLRVYEGEALVAGNGQTVTAKKGKEVSMGAVLAASGFDATTGDEFSRWAQRRAGYVATANISGARDIYANGTNWNANDWAYNPWYGMYTFIPGRRMIMSPFGFNYFPPEMAFSGMFWSMLNGGFGFYGMGFGYGYGYPYYYDGGYGYSGYNYGTPVTTPTTVGTTGGGKGHSPVRPVGYPTPQRPNIGSGNAFGNYGGASMVRGGGATPRNGEYGGSYRGGGGYSTVMGGRGGGGGSYGGGSVGHNSGGGSYSGGHSSGGGSYSSSGGGGGASHASSGGGMSSSSSSSSSVSSVSSSPAASSSAGGGGGGARVK